MTRFPAILPVFLAPLLLAGCFPRPNYRDLPNPSVISSSSSVVATVAVVDSAKPTEAELAAIADALIKGGDAGLRVRVRLPQGAPVPAADDMRRRISAMGIDPAIAVVEPNTSNSGTALAFVRISVTAPDCASLVTRSEEWSAWARPRMSFGCATYTNLSQMVADPADLAVPRNFGGADATTSTSAIERYRTDKVTPLRQTSSTSGSSSSSSSSQ